MKVFLPVWLGCFAFSATQSLDGSSEVVPPQYLDWLLQEKKYDEFNRLMGIDIPHLSRPRTGNETHHPRFSPYLEHGDMLLTPKQKEEARQGTSKSSLMWKNGVVPYYLSPEFSSSERYVISRGISRLNKHGGGCVQCKPYAGENNYIYMFPGNGCYSNFGCIGGQQTLSLDKRGCISVGTTVHELMHAIGFIHEQCRPDRDSHIKMMWNNIVRDWWSQFDMVSVDEVNQLGPYDYYSVMHYPVSHPDVSSNLPCFEFYDSSVDKNAVGNAIDATSTDVAKIRKMYC